MASRSAAACSCLLVAWCASDELVGFARVHWDRPIELRQREWLSVERELESIGTGTDAHCEPWDLRFELGEVLLRRLLQLGLVGRAVAIQPLV